MFMSRKEEEDHKTQTQRERERETETETETERERERRLQELGRKIMPIQITSISKEDKSCLRIDSD